MFFNFYFSVNFEDGLVYIIIIMIIIMVTKTFRNGIFCAVKKEWIENIGASGVSLMT